MCSVSNTSGFATGVSHVNRVAVNVAVAVHGHGDAVVPAEGVFGGEDAHSRIIVAGTQVLHPGGVGLLPGVAEGGFRRAVGDFIIGVDGVANLDLADSDTAVRGGNVGVRAEGVGDTDR